MNITNKKKFTSEMLRTLKNAANSVRGTTEFTKYNMETDVKYSEKDSYTFIGWGIPTVSSDIIEYAYIDRGFIYVKVSVCLYRYRLTDNVKELLHI